jgi:hypothetical protein
VLVVVVPGRVGLLAGRGFVGAKKRSSDFLVGVAQQASVGLAC